MSKPEPAVGPEHTVLTVLRGAEAWLDKRQVESPKRSAELLLGKVLGLDRLHLYLEHDRPLATEERAAMRELVQRRGNGEPVAHLLGSWSFRGLELEVGPAVLVPRPETEELVDLALARLPAPAAGVAAETLSVADLGTGSGAIAIALLVERPWLRVVATDVSQNALEMARTNASYHGVTDRLELLHGSWWQPVASCQRFSLVVSNPPYIDPQATMGLADDVRRFEPPLALFSAPGDAASCYRDLAVGLEHHLEPGGWFVAETGVGAAEAARDVLAAQPFLAEVDLLPDLAGQPRFVVAARRSG